MRLLPCLGYLIGRTRWRRPPLLNILSSANVTAGARRGREGARRPVTEGRLEAGRGTGETEGAVARAGRRPGKRGAEGRRNGGASSEGLSGDLTREGGKEGPGSLGTK